MPNPPQLSELRPAHGGRMVVGMKLPYPLNIKHSDKHSDNATGLKVQYIRLLVIATTGRLDMVPEGYRQPSH